MSRLVGVAIVAVVAVAGVVLGIPAAAQPTDPPEPAGDESPVTYRDAVYGDFLQVGNSVLRCPADGEDTGGAGSAADCAAITAGGTTDGEAGYNNGYLMQWSDVDSDAATFDSSRAQLTIPDGATVGYAHLTWGGHTGGYFSSLQPNCSAPTLGDATLPPDPAAGDPSEQEVRVAVGDDAAVPVPLVDDNYQATSGGLDYAEMYSDWADVTGLFQDAPTGGQLTVTVGNVWAPSGIGCAGGWSLTVVFGYPAPQGDYQSLREVAVYDDHLRVGPLRDETLRAAVPSGHASTAAVRMAVVGYDGDRGLGEERVSVDDDDVTEPCHQLSTTDFFDSCAEGALDSNDPERGVMANNLSVDSKSFVPTGLQDGPTIATVRFTATTDVTTVTELVVSQVISPQLQVAVQGSGTPVRQGDQATFSVTVTNTGDVSLSELAVSDGIAEPRPGESCTAPAPGTLAPGDSVAVTCTRIASRNPLHEEVTATAAYVAAMPAGVSRGVSAVGAADAAVIHSDLGVSRVTDHLVVRDGQPVSFTVTVTNNTADNTYSGLRYLDPSTDCDGRAVADLAPGGQATLTCVAAAVHSSFTSYGVLQGVDATGAAFPPVSSQESTVVVIHPQATSVQVADSGTVYKGSPVTMSFTVTNTGVQEQERLTDVLVTDPALPDCKPDVVPVLEIGMAVTVTCVSKPAKTVVSAPQVTSTDETGAPVTVTTAPMTITVLEPPLTVTRKVDPAVVRIGGKVTLTYTLHNASATDTLSTVVLTDPAAPACKPAPIESLAPGASSKITCGVTLDHPVTSKPTATATDPVGRPMTVSADAVAVAVLNPSLMIGVTATPQQASAGSDVQFVVAVRNTGDVGLTLAVTNDVAGACDFSVGGGGLDPGAAQTRQCTVQAVEGLRDTASFSASPVAAAHDSGQPLIGQAQAAVQVTPGQPGANGTIGPVQSASGTGVSGIQTGIAGPESAGTVGGTTSDSGSSGGTGGSGGAGGGSGSADGGPGKLAYTGVSLGWPVSLGAGALAAGTVVVFVTTRRKRPV